MAVAPRKAEKATVNETLRDRGIAHAVYLERLKAQEGQAVLRFLDEEVIPDLIERLTGRLTRIEARGIDIDPAGTQRLRDLLEEMQETVDAWTTGLSADLAQHSVQIGMAEAIWQNAVIQSVLPIRWDTLVPPTKILSAAILESPIDGVLLEDVVGRLGAGTKANIEKAVRIGIAEGEAIDRITSRIRKATDFTRTTAEAVARTAVGHASNMGRQAYYRENEDLIKAVQWHSTLDTRTCLTCGDLDGQRFDIGKGPRPPRHINCRCSTAPVLRSLRELGFNLDDFPASTRASMSGQVPESTTFNDWLKRVPPSIQDEALGPTRAGLFRTGKLEVRDFVDRGGDPYNLKQIEERESAAWAAAGL